MNNSDAVKAALDKLDVGYVEANRADERLSDGTLEFDFSDEEDVGLVFEDETGITAEPALTAPEKITVELKSEDLESEPKESLEEKAQPPKEEFSFPEEYSVKGSAPAVNPIEKTQIYTTYVPRFTEVSENYRMVNDPRPKQTTPPVSPTVSAEETEKTDPTAEIDTEISDSLNVNTQNDVKLEDFTDSLNVYKFEGNTTEDIPRADKPAFIPQREKEAVGADTYFEQQPTQEEGVNQKAAEPLSAQEHGAPKNIEIPDPVEIDTEIFTVKHQENAVEEYKVPPRGSAPVPYEAGKKVRITEYTAFNQRDSFKDKFLDSILSVKIRLFSLIFIAAVLLLYENLSLFGVNIAELLKISTVIGTYSMMDLYLAFCALVLAFPEALFGIKQLLKKKLAPEIFIVPTFLVITATVIWDCISIDDSPTLFGFIFSLQALIAVYASLTRKSTDFTAFKTVSQNDNKRVLDVTETKALTKESLALDGAVDGYKSKTVRLFRTSFISDFFKQTSARCDNSTVLAVILSVSFGTALVLALVCGLLVGGVNSAFDAMGLMFTASIPAVSLSLHRLSYAEASKLSRKNKTVIIGENSISEFSGADVITFDDTEIFGEDDVALKRFMSYGDNENTEKAMYQMSALFSLVGGPLKSIFSGALAGKRPSSAENAVIEDDGISAKVDGKRVMAGTYDYMRRQGVIIKQDSTAQPVGADTTKIMYAAEDGKVYAKFYIRYSFSEEFSGVLPDLRKNGIVPLVYTRDPNITNDLLKTLTANQGIMRVMKKTDIPTSNDDSYTRIGAGIVTFGDKMNAISAVLLAKKYSTLDQKLSKAEIAVMALGAASAAVLSLCGITLPSFAVAAWQLLTYVTLTSASAFALGKNK